MERATPKCQPKASRDLYSDSEVDSEADLEDLGAMVAPKKVDKGKSKAVDLEDPTPKVCYHFIAQ